MITVH